MGDDHVGLLRAAITDALPNDWRNAAPAGYPSQIELALVAAVFRGADEADTAFQVTARFMQARPGKRLDDLSELGGMTTEAIAAAVGPPFDTARVIGGKRMRVDLAGDLAASLVAAGVRTAEEFRYAALHRAMDLERTFTEVLSSGPTTFLQLATLLRADIRPGAEVADWIREKIGERSMSRADVHAVLQEAARKSGSEAFVLHFAISQLLAEAAEAARAEADAAAPVKEAPAKKAPANKAPAKKAPAKKAPAKKPAAAKTPAKKAPAKKAPAKKAAPKKKPGAS